MQCLLHPDIWKVFSYLIIRGREIKCEYKSFCNEWIHIWIGILLLILSNRFFFPLRLHLQQVKTLDITLHFSLKQNTLSNPSIPFPPPCINKQLPASSYWKRHCESICTVDIFHASTIVYEFQMQLPEEHLSPSTKPQGQEERAESGSLLSPTQAAKYSVNTPEGIYSLIFKCSVPNETNGTQGPSSKFTEFKYNWVITAWQASVNQMRPGDVFERWCSQAPTQLTDERRGDVPGEVSRLFYKTAEALTLFFILTQLLCQLFF